MKREMHTGGSRQQGVALVVVLILLVVVTLLGLASMRGVLMQERMAANTMARAFAFQVAESGLRQGELIARDATMTFPSKANASDPQACVAGRCSSPGPNVPLWQSDASFWRDGHAAYQTGAVVGSGNAAITPKFIIESLGEATIIGASNSGSAIDASIPPPSSSGGKQNVYRITSHAATRNGAEVVLQTMYRR